ncbi:disintegrin and metalloproteinase domain-containing protein 18-like [Thomomys bottae]
MLLFLALLAELGMLPACLENKKHKGKSRTTEKHTLALGAEGILLQLTVPRKIRPSAREVSEGQVIYIVTVDGKPFTLHLREQSGPITSPVWSHSHPLSLESLVIYIVTVDGKPFTLHLREHSFLSQNFLIYTYNETGSLHSESSYFMMHCHYQGYIAEFPNSVVTLSTCSGLRGFLQLENITYGIEPLESSAKFEHIIYQVKNGNLDVPVSAENYSSIWQNGQLYNIHLNHQAWSPSVFQGDLEHMSLLFQFPES